MNDSTSSILMIVGGILILILIFIGGCFGVSALHANYNVYSSRLAGEAELAQADFNRQIAVREAQAKLESAKLLAGAEIERAKGVAQANQIIGDSLKGNEAYLRYLWIDSLDKTSGQVIYIPTEANLPILEAGRSNKIIESK